jgi:membrane protein DedA with SNARE-associated domain
MSWRRFVIVDALSTTLQVTAVWMLGSQFRDPLSTLVRFMGDHALRLTLASTLVVALVAVRNRRRRARVAHLASDVAS